MCDNDLFHLASPSPCPGGGKCRARAQANAGAEGDKPQAVMPSLADGVRQFDSDQLFDGTKTIAIRHAGETYRLLVTRNDRLILQK